MQYQLSTVNARILFFLLLSASSAQFSLMPQPPKRHTTCTRSRSGPPRQNGQYRSGRGDETSCGGGRGQWRIKPGSRIVCCSQRPCVHTCVYACVEVVGEGKCNLPGDHDTYVCARAGVSQAMDSKY